MRHQIDAIDCEILEILQNNGRISMKELGEQVHLSAPSVTDRVSHLEDIGIIQGYTARINPAAMGYKITAVIVVMFHRGKKNEFLEFLPKEPTIVSADETPGKSDALLHIHCHDMDEFLAVISRIREFGETDSYIYMEHYKNTPLLPDI